MSTADDRARAEVKREGAGEDPVRRPIPLPPASLRPPPRVRREPSASTVTPAPRPEAKAEASGRSGARRGFLLGLLLPVVGLGLAGFLWWQNRSEGVAASDLQVRARVEQEPRAGAGTRDPDPAGSVAPEPGAGMTARVPTPASAPVSEVPVPPSQIPASGLGGPSVAGAGEVLSIQIASFRTRGRAERVLAEAKARTGLEGLIIPARVDGVRWYRILLGAFAAPEDALGAAGPLLEDGMITEILVRPVPERWIPELTGGEGSS